MNQRLIRDEGHRNAMNLGELRNRVRRWLRSGEYQGRIFELEGLPVAYILFHVGAVDVYIRHFFVEETYRRQGLGRAALSQLFALWGRRRVRVDVLVRNEKAMAFWRECGFHDYALTLERDP